MESPAGSPTNTVGAYDADMTGLTPDEAERFRDLNVKLRSIQMELNELHMTARARVDGGPSGMTWHERRAAHEIYELACQANLNTERFAEAKRLAAEKRIIEDLRYVDEKVVAWVEAKLLHWEIVGTSTEPEEGFIAWAANR